MAKAKENAGAKKVASDTALEIVVFPAKFRLRCDHAGVKLDEAHQPDVDDPARVCECGFNRTIVEVA